MTKNYLGNSGVAVYPVEQEEDDNILSSNMQC